MTITNKIYDISLKSGLRLVVISITYVNYNVIKRSDAPPVQIFFMILPLIHLIFLLQIVSNSTVNSRNFHFLSLLNHVPKKYSHFDNLPDDILTIILSYHDNFPILSQLNRHFSIAYEQNRVKLLRDRLDGFDPGKEYKKMGLLITLNYENVVDSKVLRQRIEYIYESGSSIDVRFKFMAHHVLKRFNAIVISNFFGFSSFALAVMRIIAKEDRFKDFKILFQFSYSIRRDFPSEYFQILAFIARNHEELLPTFIDTVRPRGHPFDDEPATSNYNQIFLYISVLIRISVSEEEFNSNLVAFNHYDHTIFSTTYTGPFYHRLFPFIKTDHQRTLFKIFINNSTYVPVPFLRMPLTILFEPENWPPYGTWLSLFFTSNAGILVTKDYIIDVAQMSLNLAKHWNLDWIVEDISAHMPRTIPETNQCCTIQ